MKVKGFFKDRYKETVSEGDQLVSDLKGIVSSLFKGFEFLFISLSIGITVKLVYGYKWLEILINTSIFMFTIFLIILNTKIKQKQLKEVKG